MHSRIYAAIDLKSFYASVECMDRGLDPLTTNLVVADSSRTQKTICLAVSPSLKAYGIGGRARLFEVVQRIQEINRTRGSLTAGSAAQTSFDDRALKEDPSLLVSYLVAPPRMARYIEVSAEIYRIYLNYIAPEDIHPYSIDEVFMDLTPYLTAYHMSPKELVTTMIREVLYTTGITATAGIGTNLYLAKVAMDITAKHAPVDADGVRIAYLDEEGFKRQLWNHRPLTDFWQIGKGTAARLISEHIETMGDLARYSLYQEERLYSLFGIDAELLIDHAWGIETCRMEDIKQYHPKQHSLCESQVLSRPYSYAEALLLVREMADNLTLQLVEHGLCTDSLSIHIGYSSCEHQSDLSGIKIKTDSFGRSVPCSSRGSKRLKNPTDLWSVLMDAFCTLFSESVHRKLMVHRLSLEVNHLTQSGGFYQMDLFSDQKKEEKEHALQDAVLSLRGRFGNQAVFRGSHLLEESTYLERSKQIGGHKA